MSEKQYDVVIVGSGLAGLITGAILTVKERMKVLVLEKNAEIGGRIISFGKQHGSEYSASEVKDILRDHVFSTVIKSEPDFDQIIKRGVLKDFILDGGWHAMSGGDRCRYALLARALGKPIRVSNVVGFAYFQDGKWMQLPEVAKSWSPESARERARVAYERQLISIEDSAEYDHVGVTSFMETMTDSQEVRDYYCDMARWQVGYNTAERISAGEWIRCNNATAAIGRHLIAGGGMGEITGGFKTVANTFASLILENGGEIKTRHRVTGVMIRNWKAEGVVAETEHGSEEFHASNVVCNLIAYHLPTIVPERYFPEELLQRMRSYQPLVSILGPVCLRKPLETNNPAGQWIIDRLPGTENMNIPGGPPVLGFEQTSIVDPSRAPADKYLLQVCIIIDPEAWDIPELPNKVADAMIGFMRSQYHDFDEILDWYWLQKVDIGCALAPAPGQTGDRRFPLRHPLVRNLFFAGDCVKQWDIMSNGTAHGGVLCASELSGRDYLKLLPPYWR